MTTNEAPEGSRPLPMDWPFSTAIAYLRCQAYPTAPPLVFQYELSYENDAPAHTDLNDPTAQFDTLASIWKYLDETTGKTAAERLGKEVWVLDWSKKNEWSSEVTARLQVSPSSKEVALQEAESPTSSITRSSSITRTHSREASDTSHLTFESRPLEWQQPQWIFNDYNTFHPGRGQNILPLTHETHMEKKRVTRSSSITRTHTREVSDTVFWRNESVEISQTSSAVALQEAESPAYSITRSSSITRTHIREASDTSHLTFESQPLEWRQPQWISNDYNTVHPGRGQNIYALTRETHMEKKRAIVRKLYKNLINGRRIDHKFCPALGMSPSPPYDFIRVTSSNNSGLHVFVDISNIICGFSDLLKSHRRIPLDQKVPRPAFNFTDFTGILERCRPTARRIMVGSVHEGVKMPYHHEAQKCGYELNLLERVSKARLLPKGRRGLKNSRNGYASATDAPTNGLVSNGEQGVDEILQMKMLESLVDSSPGILVLATGDAGVAEYSGGFLPNVKRALINGWLVELVGWRFNMNSAYRKLASAWPNKLHLIFLDEMAEDLFARYKPE